jgi:hypothetical protein
MSDGVDGMTEDDALTEALAGVPEAVNQLVMRAMDDGLTKEQALRSASEFYLGLALTFFYSLPPITRNDVRAQMMGIIHDLRSDPRN